MSSAMIYGCFRSSWSRCSGRARRGRPDRGHCGGNDLRVKIFSGVVSDWIGRRKPLVALGYGLSAVNKLLFPFAETASTVLVARIADRLGKGMRDAPRDALLADVTPAAIRGTGFGLRLALYTVGAVLGPLAAIALMTLSGDNFRLVFWLRSFPVLRRWWSCSSASKSRRTTIRTSEGATGPSQRSRAADGTFLVGNLHRGNFLVGSFQPRIPGVESARCSRRCGVRADHIGRHVSRLFRGLLSVRNSRRSHKSPSAARHRRGYPHRGRPDACRRAYHLDDRAGGGTVGPADGSDARASFGRHRGCCAGTAARHGLWDLRSGRRPGTFVASAGAGTLWMLAGPSGTFVAGASLAAVVIVMLLLQSMPSGLARRKGAGQELQREVDHRRMDGPSGSSRVALIVPVWMDRGRIGSGL